MTPGDRHRPPPSEAPPRARGIEQLADRLHALEVTEAVHHTEVTGRLNAGAGTFAAVTRDVEEIKKDTKPKRAGFLAIAGFVLSAGTALVTIVMTASTYVDRPALERAYDKLDDQDDELRDELGALKDRLTKAAAAIEQLERANAELGRRLETITRTRSRP